MIETDRKQIEFAAKLEQNGLRLTRSLPRVLQVNTGKLCNLTCVHCHVNAGPKRKEIITRATVDQILDWVERSPIELVDLTGGTPEMIPDFRYFVESLRGMGKRVMNRLNLTILNEPGYEWVVGFHAKHGVELVASMPCYSAENVNAQRGEGVFDSSITALQALNTLGYGKEKGLVLDLVYNPNGAQLPPDQDELEADYTEEMAKHFGIVFNNLYAITNMPIARFASYLKRNNQYEDYLQLLIENFNPGSVDGLMCRDTISVGWEGEVYDCDFNQQLNMPQTKDGAAMKLWDLDLSDWADRPILTAKHCYGCTAGQGSSCGGALLG